MSQPQLAKGFFKKHILPVLVIFLIPGFSAWFFHYAEQKTDSEILASIEHQITSDLRANPTQKQNALTFYRENPVSKIMASQSPRALELQKDFENVKSRYATFRFLKLLAWMSIGLTLLTFLIVGISVAFSLRSQPAQYWALRIGLPVMRTSALIQVLAQGILAAFLSFWVTAILTESYYIKLIFLVSFLALAGVVALIAAIFRKVDDRCHVSGRVVPEAEAPALWSRVRDLATKLDTAPPDRIIVGIDASFFVTEHPIQLGKEVLQGRTLYLSLPMLKILTMAEADAVLGHELAHFSGADTYWSRKISPLMSKFGIYLDALSTGLSIVVGLFMLMFWKLYMLSLRKSSREREFRADAVGGSVTSADAAKRALIKASSYCNYRAATVNSLLSQKKLHPDLQLAQLLEQGYPDSLKAFTQDEKAASSEIPHPFDTHPPLSQRLQHLGFDPAAALKEDVLHEPISDSWFNAIPEAANLEKSMWEQQQKSLQDFHSENLAWRLRPDGPEEEAQVLLHFPNRTFRKKDGAEATLSYDRIRVASWDAPIIFSLIQSASIDSTLTNKQRLTLVFKHMESGKKKTIQFYPADFKNNEGEMLSFFKHYYSRHKTAENILQLADADPAAK